MNLRLMAALVIVAIAGDVPSAQPPRGEWVEVDAKNNVWQIDQRDGSQDFICLPTPARLTGPGNGAAWGGRIETDGTLSEWFTVEYQGHVGDGVRVVLRLGRASPAQVQSFRTA